MPKTSCCGSFSLTMLLALFSITLVSSVLSLAQSQTKPGPATGMPAPFAQPHQASLPPQLLDELNAIKSAALIDDYAYHQLAHLTENIGPRPTGSVQAEAAVNYVGAQLRELGLDVHLEEVKVPHWVRGAETAELIEFAGQVKGAKQKIVLTALGGSTATPAEGIAADVAVVNNFDDLKAL